jgi:hypothetical protein
MRMRQKFIWGMVVAVFVVTASSASVAQTAAQRPAPDAKPALDPDALAEDFLLRLNALDDWTLSMTGDEEGVDKVIDSMMELFPAERNDPRGYIDVLAEVPPYDKDQIGPITLIGSKQIREYFNRLARTWVRLDHIFRDQTESNFEGIVLVHSKPLPWGGLSIAFQMTGNYSLREDRRRFTSKGGAFVQYGTDGKIRRLRLLFPEITEVMGL